MALYPADDLFPANDLYPESGFLDQVVRLDSSVVYQGTSISTMTGLGHLEGQTVGVYADGEYRGTSVVSGGQVVLSAPASTVVVGLPVVALIKTLPLLLIGVPASGIPFKKQISRVTLRLDDSRYLKLGPSLDNMEENAQDLDRNDSGLLDIVSPSTWNRESQLFILVDTPYPLTVQSIMPEVAVGG